jgi:cell wall assembly regulator SMI1
MPDPLPQLIKQLHATTPGATPAAIHAVEAALGPLPDDFKRFLQTHDGYEGFCHPDNYLVIHSAAELVALNESLRTDATRIGLLWFGGDGGGEGYCFDTAANPPPVLMIAFVSDWNTDAVSFEASFTEFLARCLGGR